MLQSVLQVYGTPSKVENVGYDGHWKATYNNNSTLKVYSGGYNSIRPETKITRDNKEYSVKVVAEGNKKNGAAWYETEDTTTKKKFKELLLPGDIILASGHDYMYLGKAKSYNDLKANLKTIIGANSEDIFKEITCKEYSGSEYWTIEGNIGTGVTGQGSCGICGDSKTNIPFIRNYNWSNSTGDESSVGTGKIRVIRVGTPSTNGKFSLKVKKIDRSTGNSIAGAKFHFEDRNTNPVTKRDDIVTGNDGTKQLVSNKSIESNGKTYIYSIMELQPDDNASYYIDKNPHFGINVHTGLVGNEYRATKVKVWGTGIEPHDIEAGQTHQYTTDGNWVENGNRTNKTLMILSVPASSTNMEIGITWANPPRTYGKFSMDVVKLDKETLKEVAGSNIQFDDRNAENEAGWIKYRDNDIVTTTGATKLPVVNTNGTKGYERSIDRGNKVYYYAIGEQAAPYGYKHDNKRFFGVQVHTKLNGKEYQVDKVLVHGGNIKTAEVKPGQTYYTYENNQCEVIETAKFTDELKKKSMFSLSVPAKASKMNIQVCFYNPKIEGSYSMYVGKKSSDNPGGPFIAGAKIKVSDFNTRESKEVTTSTQREVVEFSGGSKINITDIDETDRYIFQETEAPQGYEKSLASIDLQVYKTSNGREYIIDHIEYNQQEIGKGDTLWILGTGRTILNKKGNVNVPSEEIYAYIQLGESDPSFSVVIFDRPEEGKYSVKVAKKNESGTPLENAEFSASLSRNGATTCINGHSIGQTNKIVTDTGFTDIYWGESQFVTINDTTKADIYNISETKAPDGYVISNSNPIRLDVHKTKIDGIKKNIFKIDHVDIRLHGKTVTLNSSKKSAKFSYDGTEVTSGHWLEVSYTDVENGNVSVTFVDKKAKYSLDVEKVDINNRSKKLAGAYFSVSVHGKDGSPIYGRYTLESLSTGGSKNTSNDKTNPPIERNVNSNVEYITIEEITAPKDYSRLLKNVVLKVEKTNENGTYDTDSNGNYVLHAVKLANNEQAVAKPSGSKIMLDENGNSTSNEQNAVVIISVSGNKISIAWANKKLDGKYNVFLGKVDGDNLNGGYVKDITYNVNQSVNDVVKQKDVKIKTSNVLKNISGGEVKITDTSKIDKYTIEETESENEGYILHPGAYTLSVHKTIQNENTKDAKYVVDYVSVLGTKVQKGEKYWILDGDIVKKDNNVTDEQKASATAFIELNNDGTAITYVGVNRKNDIKFSITKQNYDDTSELLNETEFIVKSGKVDDYTKIKTDSSFASQNVKMTEILNGKIGAKNGNVLDEINPAKFEPNAYVYEIHEKKPSDGFRNLFYKEVNGKIQEVAYLQVLTRVDEKKNIQASYDVVFTNNCPEDLKANIELAINHVTSIKVENDVVKLYIKNTKNWYKVSIKKQKYGTANFLTNVNMTVKVDGKELSEQEKALFNKGYVTFKEDRVAVGQHTIEVFENNVAEPYVNVFDKFEGVDGVKAILNIDVTGKVALVKNGNHTFYPINKSGVVKNNQISDIEKYVQVNFSESASTINFAIKNPAKFEVDLLKKKYNGESDLSTAAKFNGKATFKIDCVEPESKKGTRFNGVLDTSTQSMKITEEDVVPNTRYKYEITETKVTGANGENNVQQDVVNNKMILIITTDGNGRICDISTGKTKLSFETTSNNTTLAKYIDLKLNDNKNKAKVYVGNMDQDNYSLELYKTDADGNLVDEFSATFNEKIIKANNKTETYENVPTENGIANLSRGSSIVERGQTHTYIINEVDAPAGFTKLPGTIEAKIKFSELGNSKIVESVSAKYYSDYENKVEEPIAGLRIDASEYPSIKLYVPNDSNTFKFVLTKTDKSGNVIQPSATGPEFSINRVQLNNNNSAEPYIHGPFDDEAARAISGEISSNSVVLDGLLQNGQKIDEMALCGNVVYNYSIVEKSAKEGYANVLENVIINAQIYTANKEENGKIIPYIQKVNYTARDALTGTDVKERVSEYVTFEINKDNPYQVDMKIINPDGYKIRLNKTDMAGNPIDTAILEASYNGSRVLSMNRIYDQAGYSHDMTGESTKTSDNYIGISKNETQTWKIYEYMVASPYRNVLAGKYIEVKVKSDNNGNITVDKNWTIKNNNNSELQADELNELKKYVSKVDLVKEGTDYILDVTIKNPAGYQLSITKCEDSFDNEMPGATIKLNDQIVINNGKTYYEKYEESKIGLVKEYKITEEATTANHINVLKDKYIKLKVVVDSEGKTQASFDIYNSNNTKINRSNSVYSKVKLEDIVYENGIPKVSIKILNPKTGKYNVKLYKTDSKGSIIKNYSATFTINKQDRNTINGAISVASGVTINNAAYSKHYSIVEKYAPIGYELLDGEIGLDVIAKDNGQKLTIDSEKSALTFNGDKIAASKEKGKYNDGESVAWFPEDTSNGYVINVYVKNEQKEFDLALRKNIVSIANKSVDIPRYPTLDLTSQISLSSNKTAKYYHTKQALEVKNGDVVKYRLNVYNEANMKGYATEITDYLQDGLEFVSYTAGDKSVNDTYKWKFYDINGNETSDMSKAKYAKTNYLKDSLLNENQLLKELVQLETEKWHDYVEIECKVVQKPTDNVSYLTNRAEITADKAVEIDKDGNESEIDIEDRDSQPNNVKKEHGDTMFNYDSTKEYGTDKYEPGYQDDDDKETVFVADKKQFKFVLNKVDDKNTPLNGACFKIDERVDGVYKQVYNKPVNKTATISEPEASGKDTVELNTTYSYRIKETDAKPGYENLLEDKYMIVNVRMNNERKLTNLSFRLYKSSGEYIASSDLYNRIKVSINNNVYPPQVNVTIPNEKIIKGKYKIILKKLDSKRQAVGGIPFNINGKERSTDEITGEVDITKDKEANNGYVEINKENKDNIDKYVVTEVLNSTGTKYIGLENPITLEISKGLRSNGEKYSVSNIKVTYNGDKVYNLPVDARVGQASGSFPVKLKNGVIVSVRIAITEAGVITLQVPNDEKDGSYKVKLLKVDENNNPIKGIKFNVTEENITLETGTNGYATKEITKTITDENVSNIDTYTFVEQDNKVQEFVKLVNPIKLSIAKIENATGYNVDFIKLEEVNTYNSTGWINIGKSATLSDVKLADKYGRTATVSVDTSTDGTITLKVENKKPEGEFSIQLRKMQLPENTPMPGIVFNVTDHVNNKQYNVTTSDDEIEGNIGYAYIAENEKVTEAKEYTYTFKEDPTQPIDNMLVITDFSWTLKFKTKYNKKINAYTIDGSTISVKLNDLGTTGTAENHQRQKELAQQLADSIHFDENNLTLGMEAVNESTIDYKFAVVKKDMQNQEISGAKFTIFEDGKAILSNAELGDVGTYLINKTNVLRNTSHKYQIYEDSAPAGYDNILEKTYIEVVFSVNENGYVSANYELKAQQDGTAEDVAETQRIIDEFIDNNNNVNDLLQLEDEVYTLNIPNPYSIVNINMDLKKFETGNENNRVSDAAFKTQGIIFEKGQNSSADEAIRRFTENDGVRLVRLFSTGGRENSIIEEDFEAEVGNVYYYMVKEFRVPNNYVSTFNTALIKVYVQRDNGESKAIASIEKVKLTEDGDWLDYNDSFKDRLDISTNGTSINLKWANTLQYNFKICKKGYEYEMPTDIFDNFDNSVGGADFTITPKGKDPLVNGLINGTEMYEQSPANSRTMYDYVINENASPNGYYNSFEDMDIIAHVYVGDNGHLSPTNSSIEVKAKAGKVVSAEKLKEANDSVEISINTVTNTATVFVANKKIKNTYDIKILKVSDKKSPDGKLVGIPNIDFSIMDYHQIWTTKTTDKDGIATFTKLKPSGNKITYAIAEDRDSAVAQGVTPLSGWVSLGVDTTGIDESMSPEEIARLLKEPIDGNSRISVTLDNRDIDKNVTTTIEGTTIIIKIENKSTDYIFNLYKMDPEGSLIRLSDGSASEFNVQYVNEGENLLNGDFINGFLVDHKTTKPNTTYEYSIKETAAKDGFINVLEGYELKVTLVTDDKGLIEDTTNNGFGGDSHFTLIPIEGKTQRYTVDEIYNNNWVRMSVNRITATDEETGEQTTTSSSVALNIINPYEYRLKLNKKDKNGTKNLNVATIVADRVKAENVNRLFEFSDSDELKSTLKSIANASGDKIEQSVSLNKKATITSDEILIDKKNGYYSYDVDQIWRIKETDVEKPYKNVLGDNSIIVGTYFNGELKLSKHYELIGEETKQFDFYVVDNQGNNLTSQYIDKIEVKAEKINGEWTLVVIVKNPMEAHLKLYKAKLGSSGEPLEGASLKLTEGSINGSNSVSIGNGTYESDELDILFGVGTKTPIFITEESSANGYVNVLDNVILVGGVYFENGNFRCKIENGMWKDTYKELSREELAKYLKYVHVASYQSDDEYPAIRITIDNPISYKFKLDKKDIDNMGLDGTNISVYSSHSKKTYNINGQPSVEFIEEDVGAHEVIEYTIREQNTKEGAYINKFNNLIRLVVLVQDGVPNIIEKYYGKENSGGSISLIKFDTLEYFDCNVTPESVNNLKQGEMCCINLVMQNPPEIKVKLTKETAGENRVAIPNTKFTIEDLDTEDAITDTHALLTDINGEISYSKEIHKSGKYSVKVYEDEVADVKYINVLENKYMKVIFNVAADGTITIESTKFYDKNNNREVTIEEEQKLLEYCSTSVDNTGDVDILKVNVQNPVKYDFNIHKVQVDGTPLEGAKFKVVSANSGDITEDTDENGEISISETWVKPGVYKYTITEINSAAKQYENVLKGYVVETYVKVNSDGSIALVADERGTNFANNIKLDQRYTVKKEDGSKADAEIEALVRDFCKIAENNSSTEIDEIVFIVENPIQTKLDIIKVQYDNDGKTETNLQGTKFTVVKNGRDILLDNVDVTEAVELEEHNLEDTSQHYDIYENQTAKDGAYVNILENRFIRVYTENKANGKVKITDSEGNVRDDFDIYEFKSSGSPTLLDKTKYKELYDNIRVSITKDENDINILNVKVLNPITINFDIYKKQVGENGKSIRNVDLTVISDITGKHDITSTNERQLFSEGNIKPGTYEYVVKENENPNKKYVNILENRYVKINFTVANNGEVTINKKTYYVDNGDENYDNDATITDEKILDVLNKYIHIDVDKTNVIRKISITIENPITVIVDLLKVDLSNKGLQNAVFNIQRFLGDEQIPLKVKGNEKTKKDGYINIDNEEVMEAGVYRYEISEIKPADTQYINILDCYPDGKKYKIVTYIKLNADGTSAFVKDAKGTALKASDTKNYYVRNRDDNSQAPADVENLVRKYAAITKTTQSNKPDKYEVKIKNTFNIDVDIIKTTIKDGKEQQLAGTKFSANMDNTEIFRNIDATANVEHRIKNIQPGKHTFYITEASGVENGGFINILENRFIKVYTNIGADGKVTILDKMGKESGNYFEIYDGSLETSGFAKLINRKENEKLYSMINISAEKQEKTNIYKINAKVVNPERNYKLVLNKKLFNKNNDEINLAGFTFQILSPVTGEVYSKVTDSNGNIEIEEKKVPVGTYKYVFTESSTSGPEFVNVLEENAVAVNLKVNQDGTIQIVDNNGMDADGKYYILDEDFKNVDFKDTIVDEYVRVDTNNNGDEPELDIFVKDPELYNFKLIKKDKDTKHRMNGVNFTLKVYGPDNKLTQLIDAKTLQIMANKTLTTKNVDGEDGVILLPNILIEKTGTYTFVFHEESTDGIFECLYKTHAEDITIKVDISKEYNKEGVAIGYVVGAPNITTGGKYIDKEGTLTTQSKVQKVRAEVTNERIKGSYNLVLSKLDKVTKQKLDGAEFDITVEKDGHEYELYRETDNVESKDVIIPGRAPDANEAEGKDIPGHCVVRNGELKIEKIRIERPETYTITLKETKAPKGYMLLDDPIVIEVTTGIEGEYDNAKYIVKTSTLTSGGNHGLVTMTNNSEEINIVAKNEYFDLALRKSITSVAYSDSNDGKITEDETENRVPVVREDDDLFKNTSTTAEYNHVKNHVRGYAGQEVIYTLRVYNEGEIDGYAEEITDHLPEGLEFIMDDKFNIERGWVIDPTDPTLRTIRTTYLSKENNPNNERFNSEKNLIKALDASTGVIDYKEIEIKCKISDDVKAKTILTNIAEISLSKANDRTAETVDRDSHTTPGAKIPGTSEEMQQYKEDELTDDRNEYVPGQEDDDDFEKIIVEEFDLALRKYITAINEDEVLADKTEEKYTDKETDDKTSEGKTTEDNNEGNTDDKNTIKYDREPRVNVSALKNGESTTATYKHTKEPLEVSVGDIVTYTLEVFNEGTVPGYASLIKDDIPEGVEFVTYKEGDGSVNDIYGWKMVNENDEEVTDPKEAKFVISDYLSKDNEETVFGNLIKAYDPDTMTTLDSKFVQVQFRVICKQDYPKIITNYAQISEDTDEDGDDVKDRDSTPNVWIDNEDDQDIEHIRVTYMDLALRKFITGVIDAKTNETQEVTTREPKVDATALIKETGTTAKYEHTKEPVLVHTNDVVIYTLRIYNEGSKDGYATQIKDDLPEGLEYLPEHPINKEYEWSLVDVNDKPVKDLKDAEYAVTNYLSKDNETDKRNNLLVAFDRPDGTKLETPAFKDIKIAFKVTEPQTSDRILINEAQISEQTDGKGKHREDRDSTPNEWLGEDDEDIEKVRVQYFDLALRKWVTKAIVTQDGKTVVTETGHHAEDDPEDIVKVDLKKSKIDSVVVKFEYQIRITNEGEIDGYAKEIKDHIPEGLRFDPADNPTWTQVSENVITTDELKGTLLKPGESAEVTVVLTWINSGANLGVKVNIAEISKDYNDYGTPDIDSTPDNYVMGEDDIDDAPVMLTVKTGQQSLLYVVLTTSVALIIGLGIYDIKRMRRK